MIFNRERVYSRRCESELQTTDAGALCHDSNCHIMRDWSDKVLRIICVIIHEINFEASSSEAW